MSVIFLQKRCEATRGFILRGGREGVKRRCCLWAGGCARGMRRDFASGGRFAHLWYDAGRAGWSGDKTRQRSASTEYQSMVRNACMP